MDEKEATEFIEIAVDRAIKDRLLSLAKILGFASLGAVVLTFFSVTTTAQKVAKERAETIALKVAEDAVALKKAELVGIVTHEKERIDNIIAQVRQIGDDAIRLSERQGALFAQAQTLSSNLTQQSEESEGLKTQARRLLAELKSAESQDLNAAIALLDTVKANRTVAGLIDAVEKLTAPLTWRELELNPPWMNYGAPYDSPGYLKDPFGVVHLRGVAKGGEDQSNLAVLPVGFRPKTHVAGLILCGDTAARLDVETDGKIQIRFGRTNYTSLDGVQFRVD